MSEGFSKVKGSSVMTFLRNSELKLAMGLTQTPKSNQKWDQLGHANSNESIYRYIITSGKTMTYFVAFLSRL
jgi:hypothetical protein